MRDLLTKFIATGAFTGYLPKAPGTAGTLVGVLLAWPFLALDYRAGAAVLIMLIALSSHVAGEAERIFKASDPGRIVIDEITGLLITVYLSPPGMRTLILGFLLFRFFDILKPFPIRRVDRALKGGFGVVADDVLAGIFANAALHVITHLVWGP